MTVDKNKKKILNRVYLYINQHNIDIIRPHV